MPPLFFADNFLAGSLLTLVLPIGLLIADRGLVRAHGQAHPRGHARRVGRAALL